MENVLLPIGLGAIGVAVFMATRTSTPAVNGGDYAEPDWSGFVPDFGSIDTAPAPTDNWSGEVYSAEEVAAVPVEGDDQLPGIVDNALNAFDLTNYMNTSTTSATDTNLRAFLDMIAYAEGTSGPEGYRVMFGYPRFPDRLISSFADHPRQYFSFTVAGVTKKTSAAGRYQFLASTWDELKKRLGLVDFGPASQDAACIELIRQRGALNDIKAGRIASAISKCAKTWASLPGAGYGQPERQMANLITQYAAAGGRTLEA